MPYTYQKQPCSRLTVKYRCENECDFSAIPLWKDASALSIINAREDGPKVENREMFATNATPRAHVWNVYVRNVRCLQHTNRPRCLFREPHNLNSKDRGQRKLKNWSELEGVKVSANLGVSLAAVRIPLQTL